MKLECILFFFKLLIDFYINYNSIVIDVICGNGNDIVYFV